MDFFSLLLRIFQRYNDERAFFFFNKNVKFF